MTQFFKIEESVGSGYYIVLDGIFETRESCEAAIQKIKGNNKNMRATRYQTSRLWNGGPVRVDEQGI